MSTGVSADAIEGLYTVICRNPTTGTGGLTPTDTSFHSKYFERYEDGEPFESVANADRLVFISYTGHTQSGSLAHPEKDHWIFGVDIQIRYHSGDHDAHTQLIMADDFHLIAKNVGAEGSRPEGCYGYVVRTSDVIATDDENYIVIISADVQVHGAA